MSVNQFPNLTRENHSVTSPKTPAYNCIAWAADDDRSWWEPNPNYYWPKGVPLEYSLSAYMKTYESIGYYECDNGELELGFTKISIYANEQGIPTHAAKQLVDGKWTSKLGQNVDISHDTPSALEGQAYGRVIKYMKRPL